MKTLKFLRAFTLDNKPVWVAVDHISAIEVVPEGGRYELYNSRVVMTNGKAYYVVSDQRGTIEEIEERKFEDSLLHLRKRSLISESN